MMMEWWKTYMSALVKEHMPIRLDDCLGMHFEYLVKIKVVLNDEDT